MSSMVAFVVLCLREDACWSLSGSKELNDQACLALDGRILVSMLLAFLWILTSSRSIKMRTNKELGQYATMWTSSLVRNAYLSTSFQDLLQTVFENGVLVKEFTFEEVRENAEIALVKSGKNKNCLVRIAGLKRQVLLKSRFTAPSAFG